MLNRICTRVRLLAERHPLNFPALLLALWLLLTAGWRPLAVPDEGRYAGIALDMARSGDWAVPLLNGLPFFHKPPLFYWITALVLKLAGPTLWAARTASLLGAWMMGMGLYLFIRRHAGQPQAWRGLMVLSTLPFFFGGAQYANLDMLVAGLISLTILAGAHAVLQAADGRPARAWVWLTYALAALGMLAKGLIGFVLPGAVLVLWLAWQRHWIGLWRLVSLPGLLVFAIIGLPWFFVMDQRFPGFFHYFFVYQHFQRFAETGFNNQLPFWFYPPALLLLTLPWSWRTVRAVRAAWKQRTSLPQKLYQPAAMAHPASLQRLWWAWLVVIVGFFSIPHSKLIGYILPCLPAWAALLAGWARAPAGSGCTPCRPALPAAAAGLCVAMIAAVALLPAPGTREAGQYLRTHAQPQEPLVMLGEYYYDLPYYFPTAQPPVVADNWDDPAIRQRDNWRKELLDAGEFAPRAQARILVAPAGLGPLLCASAAKGTAAWVMASTGAAAQSSAPPFLLQLAPVWTQPAGKKHGAALWKLEPGFIRDRLHCTSAP